MARAFDPKTTAGTTRGDDGTASPGGHSNSGKWRSVRPASHRVFISVRRVGVKRNFADTMRKVIVIFLCVATLAAWRSTSPDLPVIREDGARLPGYGCGFGERRKRPIPECMASSRATRPMSYLTPFVVTDQTVPAPLQPRPRAEHHSAGPCPCLQVLHMERRGINEASGKPCPDHITQLVLLPAGCMCTVVRTEAELARLASRLNERSSSQLRHIPNEIPNGRYLRC